MNLDLRWVSRYGIWLAACFLQQVAVQGSRPMLSLYALDRGASPAIVGILVALFAAGALVMTLPLGRFLDQFGARTAILVGSIGAAAAYLPILLFDNLFGLAITQTMIGITFVLAILGSQQGVAAVADRHDRTEYDTAFGLLTTSVSLGHAVGPGMMGAITDRFGYVPMLWLSILMLLVAGSIALLAADDRREGTAAASPGPSFRNAVALLRDPHFVRILLSGTLVLFAQDAIIAFFPIYAGSIGLTATATGLVLSFRGLSIFCLRPFLGRFSNRFGRGPLLLRSMFLGGVSMGLLGIFSSLPALILVGMINGFVIGLSQPITMTMVTESTPIDRRGLALSLRISGNRAGQTVSPLLLGAIAGPLGAASPMLFSALLLVVGAYFVGRPLALRYPRVPPAP